MSEQQVKYNGKLQQFNGGGAYCHYESDQMEKMIVAVQDQTKAIEKQTLATVAQNDNFRYITKYLLIVVCVIAVGQKALDAARDIWGHKANTVSLEKP